MEFMPVRKTHPRHVTRAKGALQRVHKMLAVGKCHPSWGQKRAATIEKFIEHKEKRIQKKRISNPHNSEF
jgi:hypothetical protein